MTIRKVISTLLLISSVYLNAQVVNPVNWAFSSKKITENTYDLTFTGTIKESWHLYGTKVPADGPLPTTINFTELKDFKTEGEIIEITKAVVKYDENFMMNIPMFSNKIILSRRVILLSQSTVNIKGYLEYICCNDRTCTPPFEVDFSFSLDADKISKSSSIISISDTSKKTVFARIDTSSIPISNTTNGDILSHGSNIKTEQATSKTSNGLWKFFIISFLGGILGLLTPCVFPMLPMTVSFFIRGSGSRSKAIMNALIFGLSIVLIYSLIGILISVSNLGAGFGNALSTHWLPNSIFFILFIAFALSFLGLFEIVLPGNLGDKTDKLVDKGGFAGSFFMALTLVIVSFSCTGPIVGSILIEAANGLSVKPIVGMFGFSLAFALPFTLLAIFPAALKNLPKSGGWMNAVKVVLAFVMLAFSLKFLSNMSQSYHLEIINRTAYLSIWISLFALLGLYLLGKITLHHDTPIQNLSIPRLLLAIAVFAFVAYLSKGLFGDPLKAISSFLPPEEIAEVNTPKSIVEDSQLCSQPLYSDILHLPHNLQGYFDLNEGLDCATKQNKPVLLSFKGHACTNCKEMENKVWSDPAVKKLLSENFLIVALYVDDRTYLKEKDWITSSYDGKVKNTMGKKNADIQITRFNSNTQPLYVILNSDGSVKVPPIGMETDIEKYLDWLKKGL